jgi:hypothetical protein
LRLLARLKAGRRIRVFRQEDRELADKSLCAGPRRPSVYRRGGYNGGKAGMQAEPAGGDAYEVASASISSRAWPNRACRSGPTRRKPIRRAAVRISSAG